MSVDKETVTHPGSTKDVAQSSDASEATWHLHELPRGTFGRSVILPVRIEATNAEATFEHGIVRLRLPKAKAAKPNKIAIRTVTANEMIETESGQVSESPEPVEQ